MKAIIERNYESVVKRGLITPDTTMEDFINKISEEYQEILQCDILPKSKEKRECQKEEIVDVILTCLNTLRHFENTENVVSLLENKIKINYERSELSRVPEK